MVSTQSCSEVPSPVDGDDDESLLHPAMASKSPATIPVGRIFLRYAPSSQRSLALIRVEAPVLGWAHAHVALEHLRQRVLVGIADVLGDLPRAQRLLAQQVGGY